jgi:hypothetical protein
MTRMNIKKETILYTLNKVTIQDKKKINGGGFALFILLLITSSISF